MSDSRQTRTFIPWSALHRHAAAPMSHWAMTGPPQRDACWITARLPAALRGCCTAR